MAEPKFLEQDGSVAADGKLLLEWLEATCDLMEEEASKGDGITAINQRHGPIKEYYVHVRKMHTLTPDEFVKNFSRSTAYNAWRVMEAIDEQAKKDAQAQEATETAATLTQGQKAIVEALEAMKAELETVKAQLAEAQQAPAEDTKPKRKGKAEPVPSEPSDETPDEGDTDGEA